MNILFMVYFSAALNWVQRLEEVCYDVASESGVVKDRQRPTRETGLYRLFKDEHLCSYMQDII